ncbi:MAG TPA: NAD(P)H-hydrate dehydratase [Candidatus Methanomethylophilaceae archaeon]|nr:ADP-dependent NAD(P)H-hydrate dehydratase / NAD(P)H-hydrate epimerase [Candidatus Methanomethylophilaceae archaeon]HIJ00876.1 NAD(P)H-hydrate dehydratase [Candidatus Methanomethylophilaceae archaeon]
MLPISEFHVLDINSAFWGVSTETLMEQAGCAVADVVLNRYPNANRIAVVCGSGNNGGDGFVAARHMIPYRDVDVLMVKPPSSIRTKASQKNYQLIEEYSQPLENADLNKYQLIVDAILGVGLKGEVVEPYATAIKQISSVDAPIVSVDCPSGLGTQLAVLPEITVTFHDIKEGMNEISCGEIIVADIGIPWEAINLTGPGEASLYPLPQMDSHKGENGRLLVIGGGPYTGAPALAALAAYRSGCDLVYVATTTTCANIVASYSPIIITHDLPGKIINSEHLDLLYQLSKKSDAVLIGPGIGTSPDTLDAIFDFLSDCDKAVIIDADAISVARSAFDGSSPDILITPHKREMERLTGEECPSDIEERREYVQSKASEWGATVLLKGAVDIISDGRRVKMNRTGIPAMTVGGTGDVLAGIASGLMSKGMSSYDAARLAAYVNGTAGERVFLLHGYGLVATDLLEHIGKIIKDAMDFGKEI